MRDEVFMAHAIKLARLGRFTTTPNPNVGCVIVKNGVIVGEGWHTRLGDQHAEIKAIQMAGKRTHGATAYITLEPCVHYGYTPPCCDALIDAGINRVVAAMKDPNPKVSGRGFYRLKQAGLDVRSNLMMKEAEELNLGFLKRMRTGFPFVQLKLGASLDGCTAMESGESRWVTSQQSRRDVQRFRAQSSAILSGSDTILIDNPSLTVRWSELDSQTKKDYPQENLRQPIRIVIDSQNRVTPQHRLLHQPGETWLARIRPDKNYLWPSSTSQLIIKEQKNHVDLVSLLLLLGKKQINHIWVEAGARLSGALLTEGVVDELIIHLAPKLLGSNTRGLCIFPELKSLQDVPTFRFNEVISIGPDLRLTLRPIDVVKKCS